MGKHTAERGYSEIKQLMFLSELNTKHIMTNNEIKAFRRHTLDVDLYRLEHTELASVLAVAEKKIEKLNRLVGDPAFKDKLERRLESALRKGIITLCSDDEQYPACLSEVDAPPAILWLYGQDIAAALHPRMITIVGTRSASPYGKRAATDISRYISLRDTTVVSGMALGIDGYAHQAAIASGGCTIAVLASGVDTVYPPTHTALYHKIVERGAVISEHPPGVQATANRFPARNRILAGLSPLTIVVESSMKSGTLITVDFALKYNRDVMVVPGNIFSPESKGCNKLIQTGAMPLIDMRDLDGYLSRKSSESDSGFLLPEGRNDDQKRIIAMLGAQHLSMDEFLHGLALDPGTVAEELAELEAIGIIMFDRGRYALTSKVESSI